MIIARLHPQSPRHSTWKSSVPVSQTLRSCTLTHITAAATYVSRRLLALSPLWLQKHTDLRAHNFAHALSTRDVSLGTLTLPAPEAGDLVELILLYIFYFVFSSEQHSINMRYRSILNPNLFFRELAVRCDTVGIARAHRSSGTAVLM